MKMLPGAIGLPSKLGEFSNSISLFEPILISPNESVQLAVDLVRGMTANPATN